MMISATKVGISVEMTNKMLRTVNRNIFLQNAGITLARAVNARQEFDYLCLLWHYEGLDMKRCACGRVFKRGGWARNHMYKLGHQPRGGDDAATN